MKFEVDKWYLVNDEYFFKFKRIVEYKNSDGDVIYGDRVSTTIAFDSDWWLKRKHIGTIKPITDLSSIQDFLPNNHADKIHKFQVDDFITIIENPSIIAKIVAVYDYYVSTDSDVVQDYEYDSIRHATNEEIIKYYERLGWVNGAICYDKNNNKCKVISLEVKCNTVIVTYNAISYNLRCLKAIHELTLATAKLPKTWEDLGVIEGCYIDSASDLVSDNEFYVGTSIKIYSLLKNKQEHH